MTQVESMMQLMKGEPLAAQCMLRLHYMSWIEMKWIRLKLKPAPA